MTVQWELAGYGRSRRLRSRRVPPAAGPGRALRGAITIGLESYWVATRFRRGLSTRAIAVLWLLICASDMLLEYPGVLTDAYAYYGHQPWEIARFPWYWAWSNGTTVFTIGFILSRIQSRLSGRDGGWILLMVPAVFVAMESVTGAPCFLALNSDLPTVLAWTLSAGTLALSLCTVRGVQLLGACSDVMAARG